MISVKSDASKKATYGELIGGKRFSLNLEPNARSASRRRTGRCSARRCPAVDMPDLRHRRGSSSSHNVRVPGHGARRGRSPAGDWRHARQRRRKLGQRTCRVTCKVVVKKNWVGVVAEKPWQAIQAAEQAEGDVDARHRACPASAISTTTCATIRGRATLRRSTRRTSTTKLAGAANVVKATYLHPYQMHGSIGSSCAVADVQGRQGDDLVGHAGRLSAAKQQRDGPRPAATRTSA